MYTFELCRTVKQRAVAGTVLSLLGNGGTLIAYILGVFLEWRMLAAVLTTFGLPYIAGVIFLLPTEEVSSGYRAG